MNDGPRLQLLRLEEVRNRYRSRIRRPWLDGLRLSRPSLLCLLLSAALLLHPHLRLVLLHGLLFELLNVLGDGQAALFRFGGELALHYLYLFGGGLLSWLWHPGGWPLRGSTSWRGTHCVLFVERATGEGWAERVTCVSIEGV